MPKAKTPTKSMMDQAKALGDDAMKLGRNAYLFSLGAVAVADESVRDMVDRTVAKGESFENSDRNLVGKAAERARELGRDVEGRFKDTVAATFRQAGVPSRDEVRTLIDRVEELTDKVDALVANR